MLAYRSEEAGWISGINAGLVNRLRYDGTRPHHNAITNRYRHNSRVRPNANIVSNPGLTPQFTVPTRRPADRKWVVDEHCTVRNKTIIADANEFADEGVRLNFAAFTYDHTTLNLNERPHKSGIADGAVVNINGFDNSDVRAKLNVSNPSRSQGGTSHPAVTSSPFTLTGHARSNTETTLRA
jgi:hypothetical protein